MLTKKNTIHKYIDFLINLLNNNAIIVVSCSFLVPFCYFTFLFSFPSDILFFVVFSKLCPCKKKKKEANCVKGLISTLCVKCWISTRVKGFRLANLFPLLQPIVVQSVATVELCKPDVPAFQLGNQSRSINL